LDDTYQKFQKQLRPMLRSRENQMLLEFAFWNAAEPVETNGIYELRTYLLKPGKMMEWETEWYNSMTTFVYNTVFELGIVGEGDWRLVASLSSQWVHGFLSWDS
jgi:hypothetical protein